MIGVSAAALALGITDGGATAIAALGVSGASLFGIGTFLSDDSRNAIYNEGKEKVICAIAAVQPLFLTKEKANEFSFALNAVKEGIDEVKSEILEVQSQIPDTESNPNAKELILSANETTEIAEAVYQAGIKLELQLSQAGNALITAVDGINAEVNKRLDGTVASLESANTIISGLATASSRLIPISEDAVKQAEKVNVESERILSSLSKKTLLVDPLESLAKANKRLASSVASVVAILDVLEPSLENLGQCKLNLQELTLAVKPEALEFREGEEATRRLIILSGKKPFAAQLLEHPVKGLTIDQPVPFGSTVEVKATNQIAAGKYHLHIVDGAERHVFIEIMVKEKEPSQ